MALPFDPLTIRTCPHNAHGTVRPGSRTSHQTPPCCLRVADTFQERGGKPHADGVRGKNALKGPPKYGLGSLFVHTNAGRETCFRRDSLILLQHTWGRTAGGASATLMGHPVTGDTLPLIISPVTNTGRQALSVELAQGM